MDPQQRAQFIDAIETACAHQGITDMYFQAQRLVSFLDSIRPHLAATQSRETLNAHLASDNPMDAKSFQQTVALCLAIGPLVQESVLNAAQTAVAAQPSKPGPPVRITPQHRRAIVEYTAHLHTQGVSLGTAQQRAAQQFGLSLRSVQRVWQQRKELAGQPFLSMDDVWKFLKLDT